MYKIRQETKVLLSSFYGLYILSKNFADWMYFYYYLDFDLLTHNYAKKHCFQFPKVSLHTTQIEAICSYRKVQITANG